MIATQIKEEIIKALKAHEMVRLDTLRLLSSALDYEKIDKMRELTEEEELTIIRRELKKRNEAAEIFGNAGDVQRQEKELSEAKVLEGLLPPQMGETEVNEIITQVINEMGSSDRSQMGKIIGEVVKRTKGQADGKKIAELVGKALQP
jgi:uncharacterized protein YqeY